MKENMTLRVGLLVVFIGIFLVNGHSQHQDLKEKPGIWQSDAKNKKDTLTLLGSFKNGVINGHFRNFFSLTDNRQPLTDYYANAVGGGLRYESAGWKGFQVGVSGFYIFNLGDSGLLEKDSVTGQPNRYEIGLYDVAETENIEEINRLEEFFIKYQWKGYQMVLGRQLLNTPFINLQDGRMRPTAAEGLWFESPANKTHQVQAGWMYGIAPRSTARWYGAEESVGVFPVGVDTSGKRSRYAGNVRSRGAFLANYRVKPVPGLDIQAWNMFAENIFNTSLIQVEWEKKLAKGFLYLGSQSALQVKTGNGGNENPDLAYNQNQKPVWIFGGRLGWKNKKWDYSVNINRISDSGKYLMPREWGRDYFYTFMPRERNEGMGDVTAMVVKAIYKMNKNFSVQTMLGQFNMPDVTNYALNKYGMPSYTQWNVDLRYRFSGWLDGLEAQVLYVKKWNQGETYDNLRYVIHKVDMQLLNVVINFRF